MEAFTMYFILVCALVFFFVGLYLRMLRLRSEKTVPAPFLNPAKKRKPKALSKKK